MNEPSPAPVPPPGLKPGWNLPRPEKLPNPTAWPVALALATTLLFWGMISSPIISGIGLALFAASLGGWIGDIRHERATH